MTKHEWILKDLGPVHTELLAIAMQKMDRISIASDASLTLTLLLRAQCEQALIPCPKFCGLCLIASKIIFKLRSFDFISLFQV